MGSQRRHDLVRQSQTQRVLDVIADHGPVTRSDIVDRSGLSRPTVLKIVRRLAADQLIRMVGSQSGSAGRSPELYALNPSVGCVIGVDLGGTKMRAAVADLEGTVLAELVEDTRHGDQALLEQLSVGCRTLADEAGMSWSQMQRLVVGSPGIVTPEGTLALADNLSISPTFKLGAALEEELGVGVIVENDVNVAAIGEGWRGKAVGCDNYAVLAVGTGVGMGLVVNGQLVRGAHGAAGEIAYLPIGASPFTADARRHGALETAAGATGIARRFRRLRGEGDSTSLGPRASVEQIFDAAQSGDHLARRVVSEEADLLAHCVLSIVAVVDPKKIILTGGIGSNPVLHDPLCRAVERMVPVDVTIERSELGPRSGVVGAVAWAIEEAHIRLFGIEPT
ncbi:MAG: ROK family transcriptional regulator [Acidimicrobiia bacterium]|nr:ROK family transcriptional regulator [Acidimicrobiia bacterium]